MIPLLIIGSLVLLTLMVIVLPHLREKKWMLVIWLPAIVLPVYIGSSLLGVLPGPMRGAGPDIGAVGMASGFYLLAILPILIGLGIIWIAALIARPRAEAWNLWSGIAGTVVCLACAGAWYGYRNETVEVVVLDEMDRPVVGQRVDFGYSAFGTGRNLGSAISDQGGIARISVPRDQYWSARTTSPDGTMCMAGLGKPEYPLTDHPDYLVGRWQWQNPDWTIWYASGLSIYSSPSNLKPLPLRFRSKDVILSPWVVAALRKEVGVLLRGERKGRLWIEEYERSPEVYLVLPELLQMAKMGVLEENQAVRSLTWLAGNLKAADRIGRIYPELPNSEDRFLFEILRQWIDPARRLKTEQEVADNIRARVADLSQAYIDIVEPYWAKHGPVGMHELGSLATPFIPRLLSVMETIPDNRSLPSFADSVNVLRPDIELVKAFFKSPNRDVAVTAILSVKGKFSPSELSDLLMPHSRPGERTWMQGQIDYALGTSIHGNKSGR